MTSGTEAVPSDGVAVRTRDLTKRFGRLTAVDRVNLEVREGDRYGFLGPNGSGKTTTVRMLLGLVFAGSGEIQVLGHPVPRGAAAALRDVGSLVEAPAAYPHLSARTNLTLLDAAGPRHSRLPRRDRGRAVAQALEQVGLAGVGGRPVRTYSLGMRQRLGLAAALVRRPRLLILDEPTNGLDPQGIQEIRDLLIALNAEGTTILLSSHLLSEVEQLCTRVGIMHRGRLVAQESLDAIRRPTGRSLVTVGDVDAAVALLDGGVVARSGQRLVVQGHPALVIRRLVEAGIDVHEVTPQRQTLEQTVLELTGPGDDRVPGRAT